MITGTMKSELVENARIWTLTVPELPQPGQLIEWDEPALGSIPARTGIRGWISSVPSSWPETVLITVAGESTRWTIIKIQGK
ncbi:MAG TPA: hypothetical protein VNB49_10500 [Candidatus Dormibacteraeota bacterium]|nr:hypothetical protein [Candidatus Dormibacteraeota bacterium]